MTYEFSVLGIQYDKLAPREFLEALTRIMVKRMFKPRFQVYIGIAAGDNVLEGVRHCSSLFVVSNQIFKCQRRCLILDKLLHSHKPAATFQPHRISCFLNPCHAPEYKLCRGQILMNASLESLTPALAVFVTTRQCPIVPANAGGPRDFDVV